MTQKRPGKNNITLVSQHETITAGVAKKNLATFSTKENSDIWKHNKLMTGADWS